MTDTHIDNTKADCTERYTPKADSKPQKNPSIGNHQKGEFHILPVDEDKKNAPPPAGKHHEHGPDLRSEFHVGPALMPGAFMSSMGTNATAFERDYHQKAKKE
ncbi:hypothetical protein BGZ93_004742 [Podila epicladia]|nr:hypothetical protein BGZ93_004742 [Podila epicladia]